ncbi:hypothetical protein E2I00_001641, partial [Balaenoptera physalus]
QKRLETLPYKPKPLKSLEAGVGTWRDECDRGEWPKGGRFRKRPSLAVLVFIPESKEPDVHQEKFEPTSYQDYFKMNQDPLGDEVLHFLLKHYNVTFKPGGLEGKLLIDLSSGPTIYQLLSACESFKEIIAINYPDKNCQELEKWLKKMPGAFDWSRDRGAEKEERLRRAIRQVLKCDILKERPLGPAVLPRPRGHLVLSGDFEASFFMVGVKRFSALPLDEKFLREALQETCFITEKLEEFPQATETRLDICSDYTRFFFLVARRRDRGSDLEEWAASRAELHPSLCHLIRVPLHLVSFT